MGLDLYRRKRDFTRTREPRGTEGAVPGHAYLIQKHAARRLHYDLRLEMDGVLKSWAVTRGPSLVAGEKRLAVHVEDHPLDYGSFEGTIPEGQYGGGTVMLWDTGSWVPVGDARVGYEKGHLTFDLKGHKLQGRWHLVRMRPRRGEGADNWLLIKAQDDAARAKNARDILEEEPDSVKTGRTLDEIAGEAGLRAKARTRRPPADAAPKARSRRPKARSQDLGEPGGPAPLPDFVAPQLATLVSKPPAGKAWIHEIKLDGYRLQARDLHRRLARIGRDRSPFTGALTADERRGVAFVAPELVAEVEFRSWTGDAHLRHAAFRGLREDKPAAEIVREDAAMDEAALVKKALSSRVRLSHPDRIYWPDDGITKAGLADYYAQVWTLMAPFIVARPLALLRCPDGIAGECFFQKHAWRGIHTAIKLRTDADGEQLLVVEDFDGLIALVQAGALELHAWGAALADLERPDIMIFDLDPGPGVAWEAVVAGAREVRARLEAQGLPAFVKTSGGKGLHVATPLVPEADWTAVKAFAKALADAMAADAPDRYVAVATKARRGGRIFIDYLRNGRGATAVAPYCPRARPGAGVAMPVAWEELDLLTGAAQFTLADAPVRLANLTADPWGGFRPAAMPLPAAQGSSRRPRAR